MKTFKKEHSFLANKITQKISCVRSVSRRGPGMSCGFDFGPAIGTLLKRSESIQKESFERENKSELPVFLVIFVDFIKKSAIMRELDPK